MNIEAFKPQVSGIAQKHALDLVVLFGSQATERTHAKSDVDIAILSHERVNRARIALELDEVFKRDDIEVVDLSMASPTLMREIVLHGKAIYEKEPDTFFRWKIYAIKIWMETAWLRRLANRKLAEWAKSL